MLTELVVTRHRELSVEVKVAVNLGEVEVVAIATDEWDFREMSLRPSIPLNCSVGICNSPATIHDRLLRPEQMRIANANFCVKDTNFCLENMTMWFKNAKPCLVYES